MKGGGYYPATINAMKEAGADRIFVIGGVPAMALMAFGMGVVEPVDILCGAGNKFVAEAKRQLFGQCGIDLLAGPTEIAIIADDSADPALVACDLLGQAEHDPNSGQLCVCLSENFARETLRELERQLAVLPTREIAEVLLARLRQTLCGRGPRRGDSDFRRLCAGTPGAARQRADYLFPAATQLRFAVHRRGNHRRLRRQKHRHESHSPHEPFRALHGWSLGGKIPEDRHLSDE